MTTPDPNEAHNLAEGLDRERGASWIFSSRAAHQLRAMADENVRLTGALKKANDQAEHFEREWYLRGDELERLRAQVAPAGWKLVPAEAIRDMLTASDLLSERWKARSKAVSKRLAEHVAASVEFAMLAASPAAPAQQAEPSKPDSLDSGLSSNPSLTVGDERGLALWQLIYGAIAHEPLPLKVGQIERAAKRVEDMLKRRAAAQAEPVAVKALGAEIAHEHDEALAELAAKAEAQFQADIRDAARYRVLRDKQYSFGPRITDPANVWLTYTPEGLDQACDEMLTFEAGSNPPAQGTGELPPLPEPEVFSEGADEYRYFTADQMHAYARVALAQQKEQA